MARKYVHFRNAHLAWEEAGWNPTPISFDWQDAADHSEQRPVARPQVSSPNETKHGEEK